MAKKGKRRAREARGSDAAAPRPQPQRPRREPQEPASRAAKRTRAAGSEAGGAGRADSVPAAERTRVLAWLRDAKGVREFLDGRVDLVDALNGGDGLVRLRNFAPPDVAAAALAMLKELPGERWELRADRDDPAANTTSHRFLVANPRAEGDDPLAALTGFVHALLPEKRSVFSAARYERGGHISEHDDHAYVEHEMPDGSDGGKPVLCSRDVAVIWYLTKDWRESDGGVLVDLQTGQRHVPEFNSLVAFLIPRFHEVTPVFERPGRDPRYTIFGWFLAEGDLYNYVPEEQASTAPSAASQSQGRSGGGGGGGGGDRRSSKHKNNRTGHKKKKKHKR